MRLPHILGSPMARRPKRIYRDLRAYFEHSGDTQAAFAARVSRSQSWVSRVVNGELEPSLADALAIVSAANVPLESLIAAPVAHAGSR